MKKIFLFHLATLALMPRALSQNTSDSLSKNPACFFMVRAATKPHTQSVSKIFCLGDEIKVKLNDNQIIRGPLDQISKYHRITVNGTEIDAGTIQWIGKSKLQTGSAIAGGLVTAAGIALMINGTDPDLGFTSGPAQVGLGVLLVGTL